jgi:ABC-type transport system substrate-binding protein
MPFGFFSDKRVDELIEAQSHETNLETRKAMVQEVNLITSTKVAFVFLYHRISILVHHRKVNYPAKSRIPGLVELDRVSFV